MSYTSLPINQALFLAGLELPNKMSMVYSRDFGYNILTQLAAQAGPSISSSHPKVEVSSLGSLSVFSQITAAPSLSGTELTVTVATTKGFRVGDVVADGNLAKARVKTVGTTTLVLEEMYDSSLSTGVALNASTHFQSGDTCTVLFDASANYNSGGKTTKKYVPETDYTYLAVTRESGSQTRRERTQSYVEWNGNYWHTGWMDLTVKQFSKQLELKYALSEMGAYNVGGADEYYTTQGLRSAIIDKGEYFSGTSQLTLDEFNDMLSTMRRKVSGNGRNLLALMGTDILGRLQTLIGSSYITYVGTNNTFGGASVSGIDIYQYDYLGMKVRFATWDLLSDPMFAGKISTITGTPKMNNSIYFIDMTPIESADGRGTISPIQKYHFNNDELIAGFVPGMIGLTDSNPSTVKQAIANGITGSMMVSDLDNVSFHVLSDCGVYFAAERFGLYELAS